MIRFYCKSCLEEISVPDDQAGKQTTCKCGESCDVPLESLIASGQPKVKDGKISFECPKCGKKLSAPQEKAGASAKCSCGSSVTVPGGRSIRKLGPRPSAVESGIPQSFMTGKSEVWGLVAILGILLFAVIVGWSSYALGKGKGEKSGRDTGFKEGLLKGESTGYENGETAGYEKGEEYGRREGKKEGKKEGYESGKAEGETIGYEKGRTEGEAVGFEKGFEKGFTDTVLLYHKPKSTDQQGLGGIEKLAVLIEEIPKNAQPYITESELRTITELQLRREGVSIVPVKDSKGVLLCVLLGTTTMKIEDNIVLSIKVSLTQPCRLERNLHIRTWGETWTSETFGFCISSQFHETATGVLKGKLDEFANAYLAANPKK